MMILRSVLAGFSASLVLLPSPCLEPTARHLNNRVHHLALRSRTFSPTRYKLPGHSALGEESNPVIPD